MNMLTDLRAEVLRGDGKTKSFYLTYEVASKPIIRVGDDYQTVGIVGVDRDCAFYWQEGGRVITQDERVTVLPIGARLDVIYQGQYEVIKYVLDSTENPEYPTVEYVRGGDV
jgi:hypothetical protein